MSLQRNKVTVAGNLTRDPELKHTPSGMAVTEISVATNRKYKSKDGSLQEEATFVEVTFWGATAEAVAKFYERGRGILVDGRLKLDTWEDKETGAKRSKLRVVGESFDFTDSKPQDGSGAVNGAQAAPRAASAPVEPEDDQVIPF